MWGDTSLWFYISIMINDVDSLFVFLLIICMSSSETVCSDILPIFKVDTSLRVFFLIINGCWICQIFFCIYWDGHMIFILYFVNVVYHINWFADVETSSHHWNKSYLIMVYVPWSEFSLLIFCGWISHLYLSGTLMCNPLLQSLSIFVFLHSFQV